MWILLSELTERSLEVVGLHGHVVVVRSQRALHLVEPGLALRIRAAVIHIVAQEIRATAQLHDSHRVGIFRIDVWPTVIGRHHAPAQFAGEVWVLFVTLIECPPLLSQLLCGNGRRRTESLKVESLVVAASRLLDATLPETVCIVAIEGYHLSEGHGLRQLRPASTGIERQVEADLRSNPLQGHQIVATAAIFVVKLAGHHGAAVFPLQSLHLRKYLAIEAFYVSQKDWILRPHLAALGEQPVRDAATTRLTMTERSYAQHHRQALRLTHLKECPEVALSAPVEDTLRFLYMVPEHVAGNDGDTAFFHLPHFPTPLVGRDARIVHFTHHRTDTPSVDHQTILIPCNHWHLPHCNQRQAGEP